MSTIFADPPDLRSWSVHFRMRDGEIITVDYLWLTADDWEGSPFESDPSWSIERLGPFVLATRVLA